MTPEEREQLNAQAARLAGWKWKEKEFLPDYLGDPRLWAPILERELKAGWELSWAEIDEDERAYVLQNVPVLWPNNAGATIAEAVLRLFVALKGEV